MYEEDTGLIYMRARYYSPILRRFVNADKVHGDISNALTLNRYAFVNGNPASNVDPMGLCREGSQYGSLTYRGDLYPIYVPTYDKGYHWTTPGQWKTVHIIEKSKPNYNWYNVMEQLATMELDDCNGVLTGENPNCWMVGKANSVKLGVLSITGSLANAFLSGSEAEYIKIVYQEKDGKRRSIIYAGSSDINDKYNACADGYSHGLRISKNGDPFLQADLSDSIEELYTDLTGSSDGNPLTIYDISVRLDERHKNSKYSSYMWFADDGTIMQTPVIYSKDKVQMGTTDLYGISFDPLYTLPIDGPAPASDNSKYLLLLALLESYK